MYIFYKDNANSCWWEEGHDGTLCKRPFGHYVFTLINTANAMKDKETFVNSEYVWLSGSNRIVKALGWVDNSGTLKKDRLEKYYDEHIANNESVSRWKDEFALLLEYMKNLQNFRNSKTAKKDLLGIYTHFKYFATCICSDKYDYIAQTENKRNMHFDSIYTELVSFNGYSLVGSEEDVENSACCEMYQCEELFNIFIIDFWEFLFNPACQKSTLHFCKNCNSMFMNSNNKAKYCEVCRQPEVMAKIRYANRKSNTARKLHQEVLTLAYGMEKKPNDTSNSFLNESNYYWDIVSGKKPEKIKGYSNRIKTEQQYIEWLEKKREELKKI